MGGGLHRPAGRPVPHDRPEPEYPLPPGHPPAPGYRPVPAERPADCPLPGYLAALDQPSLPDCPPAPGYPPPSDGMAPPDGMAPDGLRVAQLPPVADRPPVPDYPALPHYLSVRGHPAVPGWPPAPPMGTRAVLRRLAGLRPGRPARAGTDGRRTAALGYLTVPVPVVPLVIYLSALRGPRPARRHAAQALNVWFTGALYDLSAVIMGAMLALDSPRVALVVFAPLVAARWLVTLAYLVRAARAASRGAAFAFPAWLCMRVVR